MKNFDYLDVSMYEAPQPLLLILDAIKNLTNNRKLVVTHRIEPTRLFQMISEKYNYTVTKKNDLFEIVIWIKNV